MQCCNCLSQKARLERPYLFEWILAPIMAPVFCNACLKRYYVLSLVAVSSIIRSNRGAAA
ncbi:MAG TPA: hypothetical protein VG713_00935 [Pirellulales bacterium]|nr:hypothetical protein [Pirellulales bacterium]